MSPRKTSRRVTVPPAPAVSALPVPVTPPINMWEYPSVGVQLSENVEGDFGVADHTVSMGLNHYGDIVLRVVRGFALTNAPTGQNRRTEMELLSMELDQDEAELDLFVTLLRNALDAYPRLKAIREQMKAEGVSAAA